ARPLRPGPPREPWSRPSRALLREQRRLGAHRAGRPPRDAVAPLRNRRALRGVTAVTKEETMRKLIVLLGVAALVSAPAAFGKERNVSMIGAPAAPKAGQAF